MIYKCHFQPHLGTISIWKCDNVAHSWRTHLDSGYFGSPFPLKFTFKKDIILYNNAHGSPTIAAITKADVYSNGSVFWEPPVAKIWNIGHFIIKKVVYNSMCAIDIKWFPYDEQECYMKFGAFFAIYERLF